jgi:casein kinase II subunit alpha
MPPKKYPKSTRRKGALRSVARSYAEAAAQQPALYWNDVCSIEWGNQEKYEVLQQLGKGKYGEVFEGVNLEDGGRCVVKIMRPVKEQRLKREIKILRLVSGGPNIITLHEVVRDPDTKTPCFIFDFVDSMPLKELQSVVTDMDVRSYMYQVSNRPACGRQEPAAASSSQRGVMQPVTRQIQVSWQFQVDQPGFAAQLEQD